MTTSPEVKGLASRLARIEKLLKQRGDQLTYSSFDDGALREFKTDETGAATQVAQYGQQYDGTSGAATLVSPAPPAPSVPYAVGVAGGINVTLDGTFEGDPTIVAPMDFKGFDVVVGPIGFDPIATPPILTVVSPRGGSVFVALPPGNYEVAAVTRTLSGRPSLPSPVDAATAFGSPTQAEVEQALADAAAAQAAADAANGVADDALAAANAKNAVIHADADPVGEPNTLGDTWFTHDVTSGAIIAQWRGMGGTTWQQDTISHQVISSIDLGVATVGKLAANYIDTGTLTAALQVAGMIIAGLPTGARVVIDGAGIRQFSASGDIRINLPTDPDVPAQFEGNAIVDSLTVVDFLAIRGINNEISKGAVVSLSSGTTAPSSAPSIAVSYATYTSPRHQNTYIHVPTGHCGSVDDSDDFYGTYTFYGYGRMNGPAGKKYDFPERTDNSGYTRGQYNFDTSTAIAIGGAERVVGVGWRTLNNGDAPSGYLSIWDPAPMNSGGTVSPTLKVGLSITTDNYVWVTKVGRVYGSGSTWANRFALGISQSLVNQFTLKVYSATDTAITQVGTDIVVTSPLVTDEVFAGITYGDSAKMGFHGAAQSLWLIHGTVNTYAYSSAGVRLPQFDFPTPAGQRVMCAWGDPVTNAFIGFRTTAWKSDSLITKLTNNHWDSATTSSKWWLSVTWYDPDTTGGTHETAQSNRASITMPKRAGLTYTVPTYPARPFPTTTDDVLASRVYLSRGNTDPGRTYMERADTVTSPTRSGFIGTFAFPAGVATAPPPAASNFPTSAPAKVQSADGSSWFLQGDGYATLGTLEVGLNAGTTLKNAIEISVGDIASTSQRLMRFFKKATSGANYYESREYMYDGVTTAGKVFGILENGANLANFIMRPNAQLDVQGVGANVGKADIALQGVSVGRGLVPGGYAALTAGDGTPAPSGTIVDTGLAVTVSLRSDRRYKLTCMGGIKPSVAGERGAAILREGTTNLQVSQTPVLPTANSSVGFTIMKIIDGPTTGTHTYKVGVQRVGAGTGSITIIGGAFPTELILEDIGAAGV